MLIFSQRWNGRLRRITALAAVYAFLCAGGLAFEHTHAIPKGHFPEAKWSRVPELHCSDSTPGHNPGQCLACLWSRAAISGPPGTRPTVAYVTTAHVFHPTGARQYHSFRYSTHSSRAPPVLPL